jgi:hypothetical protein
MGIVLRRAGGVMRMTVIAGATFGLERGSTRVADGRRCRRADAGEKVRSRAWRNQAERVYL